MREGNDAARLLGYLYGQLEMLADVDRSDEGAVDAACKVSKAVNDTAGNIVKIAEASMRAAMLRSNVTGSVDIPSFFLGEGGVE